MVTEYHAPSRLDEAVLLMRTRALTVVAGGTDLFTAETRARRAPGAGILDLTRIEGLRGIEAHPDGGLRIGAATTWSDILRADLPPAFRGLQDAAREVGSVQIQNAATLAGNICNASPAADGIPPLLTLEAEVTLAGPDGTRSLPLSGFVTGPRRTALRPGEVVTALRLPAPPAGAAGAFVKLGARRYLVISIAMASALVSLDAGGRIAAARVGVGACSPVACRLPALEADLVGRRPEEVAVTSHHLAPLVPISDVRADAAYRQEAVAHLVRAALRRAAARHG